MIDARRTRKALRLAERRQRRAGATDRPDPAPVGPLPAPVTVVAPSGKVAVPTRTRQRAALYLVALALAEAVTAMTIADDWIDTGKKDDMLEANRLVLMLLDRRIAGEVDAASPVVVEPGASVSGSTVRGPAIIGRNARITDAYVGPFTAVGPGCELSNCEIEGSIVPEQSLIRDGDGAFAAYYAAQYGRRLAGAGAVQ